jgi:diaminopimelate decarboxylase
VTSPPSDRPVDASTPAGTTVPAAVPADHPLDWWRRPGLDVRGGRLTIAGRDAEALAREHGVPLFVYDLTHMEENVRTLQAAMARTGLPWKVRWALKAQRQPEVLARLRSIGEPGSPAFVGLDVCSPGEVEHGLTHGWPAAEISYTGTNVSDRDLDVLLEQGVHVNLDLLSQIERYGRRDRGGTIGLRINPRVSAARPESGISYYSGEKPTKFGIYPERLDEAIALARSQELTIDTVHFHVSHHLLDDDLPAFDRAVGAAAAMVRRAMDAGCPIREVNAGGGLAAVMRQGQRPLDLDAYAGILADHLGPLGVTIACEPGEMFSKNAGVALAEVVTLEDRSAAGDGSAVFAGLTIGWNLVSLRFVYKEHVETVLCRAAAAPRTARYTVTSHINEGPDIFAEDYALPTLREGDVVALLGVGCYCQANWHEHCLRPFPEVVWFEDRLGS